MSSRRERKKIKLFLILVCCFVFGIGYYLLNDVSTWFEVPLGVTFYVVLGGSLMAISGVYIGYAINQLFFKKKRKRTKRVYLDEKSDDKTE